MENRREFLKKTGIAVGVAAISSNTFGSTILNSGFTSKDLNDEERAFLLKFADWTKECLEIVKEENKNYRILKNNISIPDIGEKCVEWMPKAKKFMKNPAFFKEFMAISDELTNAIQNPSYNTDSI